jgi:hypothetical protein
MYLITKCTLLVLGVAGSVSGAGMVHFENTGTLGAMTYFDPNFGSTILGDALDITRSQFDQPALGDTPTGSVFFMNLIDFNGDFIWLGTGSTTRTSRSSDATVIRTPSGPEGLEFYGPQMYLPNGMIDTGANFVDGWRTIHGWNNLTGLPGVFTIDERFAVGVEFELDGQIHYGYAEFKTDFVVFAQQIELSIYPTRWGYNNVAGESARLIPSPAGIGIFAMGSLVLTRRRR